MRISLAKLWKEPGVKEDFAFVWENYSEDLGEASLIKPLQVKGNISNRGNYLELMLSIDTEITLPCSRCLEEVRLPLKLEVTEQYCAEEEWMKYDQLKDTYSSVIFLENEDWLDLKEVVQENLLLSLPMRMLCTPDCPGICPDCGKNLKKGQCNCQKQDYDLRFEALAQLKKKLES